MRRLGQPLSLAGIVLLLAGLLVPAGAAGPPAGPAADRPPGPTLIEVGDERIVLEWAAPAYDLATGQVEGQAVDLLSMSACPPAGQPGEPQLPVCTFLLGIPPDATLTLRVLEEETVLLPGPFRLPPVPGQAVSEDMLPTGPFGVWPAGKVHQEGPAYDRDAPFPEQAASLGEPAFLRHQRIVPLRIYPFRYRPQSGQLLHHPFLRLEIAFSGRSEPTGFLAEPPAFEQILRRSLLNYDAARRWRRLTAQPLDLPPPPPEPGYRIPVERAGLYRLTYERLQQAGLPVDTLDPHTIRLFRWGTEVPLLVLGEEDDSFDPGDQVLFYGRPITDSRYTATEVYWLTYGGAAGLRMAQRSAPPVGAPPVSSFWTVEHLEENLAYYSQMPWRAGHDHWFWNYTFPEGGLFEQTYLFPPHPLADETYSATLRLYLYSWTRDSEVNPDHHLRVYVNDTLVEELWWDGRLELTLTITFSSALLQEGGNVVRLETPGDTGAFAEVNFYDWLELGQRRRFLAEGDSLTWSGPGDREYRLSNFSQPAVWLLDITDPDAPVEIVSATVTPEPPSYTVRFRDRLTHPARYLAVEQARLLEPASIEAATPTDLRDPANQADYLVITPRDLYTQALSLAAFRESQGLEAAVVDVQEIYDLFGYGRRTPEVVRDFLAYTYETWSPPAPAYVVLLGDGHYDFKDYWGYGKPNLILPYMAFVDPWIGETIADNRYVCLSGEDTLPDMHLGRLPANTPEEAQVMVSKVIAYEGSPPPGETWRHRSLFVADNADAAGDFAYFSDRLISTSYPLPYQPERVYLGVTHPITDPQQARQAIVDAINDGRLLVHYIGHAGFAVWASERLLNTAALNNLHNGPYYPLALPMTCYEGFFAYPQPWSLYSSMAEIAVRLEGQGWIASWSPTGLGVVTGHDYLDKGVVQAFFLHDVRRLGPATMAGKVALYRAGAWLDLLDTYNLLGDPALQVPLLPVDLAVDKTSTPEAVVSPGDPLTFTLTISNSGPATAHHVVLSDVLAPLLLSPTVEVEGLTLTQRPGPSYTWAVSDVVAGQVGTVRIRAYVSPESPAGFLINLARVSTGALDSDPQDNTAEVILIIASGEPSQVDLSANPPALPADGASLTLLRAEVRDAGGNPVADGTPVLFTTDAGIFPDGNTYQSETGRGIAEAILQASDQVLTATIVAAAGSAWSQVVVPFLPMRPHTVTVQAVPATIPLTGTAEITATVQDRLGHPVADGTPLLLTASLGLLTPTLGTTQGGLFRATLTGQGQAGLSTIVAQSEGAAGAATVQIGPGSARPLTLTAFPETLPADGQAQAQVTATLTGPISGTPTVHFYSTLGTIPAQAPAPSGTAVVSLTAGTTAGRALLLAWSEGASGWTSVDLLPGEAGLLTLTARPAAIPVGGHHSLIWAGVRDPWGNPPSDGTLVFISTTLGTLTPTTIPLLDGTAQAILTSGTQAGTATLFARSGAAGGTAAVRFQPLLAATVTLQVTPSVIPADGGSTATLSAWAGDPFGNPVEEGTPASFASTLGQVSPTMVLTHRGWATTTLTSGTTVGTATLHVWVDTAQAEAQVLLSPGPPSILLLTAEPSQLTADGVSTATVTAYLWDAWGHTVADGTPVSLSASLGMLFPTEGWTQDGQVQVTLRSALTVGTSLVQAHSGDAAGSLGVPFIPGPPVTLWLQANPAELPADGVSTATVSAYLEDAWGHPVAAGTPVTLSASLGAITPAVVLTTDGWATSTFYAGTTIGWATLTGESGTAWGETQVFLSGAYRIFLPLVLKAAP